MIGEDGRVEVTDMFWYDPPVIEEDHPSWYLASGTGGEFLSVAEALAGLQSAAAAEGGFVASFSVNELHVLEKFTGYDVPFNIFDQTDRFDRDTMLEYIDAFANIELQIALTVAVQGELSEFFTDITYDEDTDLFVADTALELQTTYEALLSAAAAAPDASAYLAEWAPFMRLFLGQYDRGGDLLNTYSYQFANLVRGFETFGDYPIDIKAAADALGILQVTLGPGTDDFDIFYLSTVSQTFEGGGSHDNYVVGKDFADHVIHDVETVQDDVQDADFIRFASHNASDLSFARNGNDLLITDTVTGNTITVVDQFLRQRPGLVGAIDDDRGVAEIIFADGEVWDPFDIAKAVIITSSGDQTVVGTRHIDWFDGGAGDDELLGGNSADFYVFGAGDGTDTIYEYGAAQLEENDFWLLLNSEKDWVIFEDDIAFGELHFARSDNLEDLIITHTPSGSSITIKEQFVTTNTGPFGIVRFNEIELFSFDNGDGVITANEVMDILLVGTEGNDTIYGYYRPDVFRDTAGDDFYSGGDDNDTYYFGRDGGANTLVEAQTNVLTASDDTLVFTGDISPDDVIFRRVPGTLDLEVSLSDVSTSILIENQFDETDTGPFGIQWFDRIETFRFESDPDTVWTFEDIMARLLEEGRTDGDDLIEGYYREDVLDGGAGNDMLIGAALDDTYIFDVGYGHDTISDQSLFSDGDTVSFGAGVSLSDLSVGRNGDDLVLTLESTGDTLTIIDQHQRNNSGSSFGLIEQFQFADGTMLTADYWRAQTLTGTEADDTIVGYEYDDVLSGGAGTDRLEGSGGNDTYLFNLGDGNDVVFEQSGGVSLGLDDRIVFGEGLTVADLSVSRNGNDLVFSFASGDSLTIEDQFAHEWLYVVEQFEFSDGTVWTEEDVRNLLLVPTDGDDVIIGYDTDDVLTGGAGTDRLEGYSGQDTYLFNLGDGHDTIFDNPSNVALGTEDQIVFGEGLLAYEAVVRREGGDLNITFPSGDRLTVEDHFRTSSLWAVEMFTFADGTVWTVDDIRDLLLRPSDGDDHIIGYDTDDVLTGGAGTDRLEGGNGEDTYLFNLGDGNDTIRDYPANVRYGTDDKIIFGEGLSFSELNLTQVGNDLVIDFGGADTLTIERYFSSTWIWVIEQFEFADGTVLNTPEITSILNDGLPAMGTLEADIYAGTSGADTFAGLDGNDRLSGQEGDDILYGGYGIDILDGGAGADRLDGGAGIDYADYRASGAGVTIDLASGTGLGGDAEGDTFFGIERVYGSEFADTFIGDDSNNMFFGFGGDDILNGGAGNDILRGMEGADTLIGGSGIDYADYRDSGAGVTIDLSAGTGLGGDAEGDTLLEIERVYGSEFADTFIGDDSNNMFFGFGGDDVLNGGAGNDILRGMAGADTLIGGSGIDYADYRDSDAGVTIDLAAGAGLGGDAEGDTLIGIERAYGSAFGDTFIVDDGNNMFFGYDGDDVLNGGAGNDILRGMAGGDTLNGGAGIDYADYRDSGAGVTIDLAAGIGLGGDAEGDTLADIERVYGSEFADTFIGDDGNNMFFGFDGDDVLNGGAGNDILRGGAGTDTLNGGAGFDFADYRGSSSGVTVDLAAGTGLGGDAEGDKLIDVERAYGSSFADTIIGDDGKNMLFGFDGDDTLNGGAGNDVLVGGAGQRYLCL